MFNSAEANIKDLIMSKIPSKFIDSRYSLKWNDDDKDKCYIRGGKPYYCPTDFQSIGLCADNFDENTNVAYHGVSINSLANIIQDGFKLPSEHMSKAKDGHLPIGNTFFGIPNYADAIFVTPSIKYASLFGMQNENVLNDLESILIVVLQVRVKPNSFTVLQNSTCYNINDPHFPDDQIDWRIANPKDVIPYRVLYKVMKKEDFQNLYSIMK